MNALDSIHSTQSGKKAFLSRVQTRPLRSPEAGLMPEERLNDLMREADELLAITVSSIKTTRKKLRNRKNM